MRVVLFMLLGLGGCGSSQTVSGQADTSGTGDTTGPEAPEDVIYADRVLNLAHRGGGGVRPEHTLVAYDKARLDGADILELDIHATADGVLVVMHDDTVDRTTDGSGMIKNMTFDELRTLDAAYTFTTDGGQTFPYRGMGIQVPSVEEVLIAHPDMPYVIELKQATPSIVGPFLALCDQHGILDQMIASAFDDATAEELRLAAPELPTSFSFPEVIEFLALTVEEETSYMPPAKFLQVPPEQLGVQVITAANVEKAHRVGLLVHAWTINETVQMEAMIAFGVDGIFTDYPARLRDVLNP